MKKLIITAFLLLFLSFSSTSFAQVSPKFEASISGTNGVAILSGVPAADRENIKVAVTTWAPVSNIATCDDWLGQFICVQPPKEILSDGTIKWTTPLKLWHGKTDYYVRAEGKIGGVMYFSPVVKINTPNEVVDAVWPLTYSVGDTNANISGKLNNVDPEDFTATLQYSTKQFDEAGEVLPTGAHATNAKIGTNGADGINPDHSYIFQLTDLSPNTLYFTKQIIKADKYGALDIKVNNTGFNSSTGYKAEGSKEQLDDIKKRSYTLLAPFSEKLQVVLDPDLCREFVAQGKRPAGSCDNQISDFLNLMLSILIGVAVVVLVVQIILKGYQYMVTDIPFLKASAKSRLLEASLGLLLALSSYLILNTINPKLVSNDINIDTVQISVEDSIKMEAIEVSQGGGGSGTIKLCSNPSTCLALCNSTNNGQNYTDKPPGVMDAGLAKKIENIPLVTAKCTNCTASASVSQGLNNLKPSIDALIAQNAIKSRSYTFVINSGYRPAKDQIRIMCAADHKANNFKDIGSLYAYPALSKHGVGTAVDIGFLWDGKSVINCYNTRAEGTIEKIMDKAGFQRLVGEAWHFEYGGGPQTCKYPNCPPPTRCHI